MNDQRRRDEEYARYEPYAQEIQTLITQHLRRQPDPSVLADVWRIGYMLVLVEAIKGTRMLPDQIEQYLSRSCAELVRTTLECLREWDTGEWRTRFSGE